MPETESNFAALAIGISAFTLLATLAIAWAAVYSAKLAKEAARIAEHGFFSQIIFSALRQYDDLGPVMTKIGYWSRIPENSDNLKKLSTLKDQAESLNIIKSFSIEDDLWMEARKIKQYFKSFFLLHKAGLIPRHVLLIIINRYGYNLLQEVIFPMDVYRFFHIRKQKTISSDEINKEFGWYKEMRAMLSQYDISLSLEDRR